MATLPMKRKNRILRHYLTAVSAVIARFLCIALLLASCWAGGGGSNDGSSKDSSESQSQDYDDLANDDAYDYAWQADDPYMPTDDYVLQQIKAEMEAEYEAELNAMNAESESDDDVEGMNKMLIYFVAGSVGILGLASALFCTSVFLYFLRVQSLMHGFKRNGAVVEGRILASHPDIDDAMKKANATEPPAKIQNNDSYSMMTDDASYHSGFSNSDGSGVNDIEEGPRSYTMEEKGQHHAVISGISFAGGSAQTSTAKSKQQISNENTTISEGKRKFLSKSFRVIVEYDDITYLDVINQESSEIIRKRLRVMGKDIDETSTKSNPLVKLYVLPKQPKSGYPCGEVHRALRWEKMLSINLYIVLAVALIIGGAFAAKSMLSAHLFGVYIVLLFLQVPILNCFLQGSFSHIISKEYLENGLSLPSKRLVKYYSKEQMVSALKYGTSLDFA